MTLAVVCDAELENGDLCMRQQQVRGMDPEERAEFLAMIGWTTNEKGHDICPFCGGDEQEEKLRKVFDQSVHEPEESSPPCKSCGKYCGGDKRM